MHAESQRDGRETAIDLDGGSAELNVQDEFLYLRFAVLSNLENVSHDVHGTA